MQPSQILSVRGVVFDLSGTVIDYGSRGPVIAFVELFRRYGIQVDQDQARQPMGLHKRDHIRSMLADASVQAHWTNVHGAAPTEDTVEQLYRDFVPLQIEVLREHSGLIPGAARVALALRERGIKFATTTGFDSGMIQDLARQARDGGFEPDVMVCPDHVGQGRPAPWMALDAARQMGVYPIRTLVKVGDTPADVAEAHAAGMWAVAIVRSGNEVGLSAADLDALPPGEQESRVAEARSRLAACGPHYLIDSVADLLPILDNITARLARGDRP
jgi:phosphonoacetaldehyde hydrolase